MDTYQFSQVLGATAVAYSPGSTFIATAQADQVSVRLTTSLEAVRTWTCISNSETAVRWAVEYVQWSADGLRVLAHSSKLGTAWVFNLTGVDAVCRLTGIDAVEWAGEDVVSFSDRGMSLHNLQSGESRFIQNVQTLRSWSPDSRYLATVERHQGKDFVGVYDKESLVRHFAIPTTETAGILWSPCGKWLAIWDWHISYSLYIYSPVGAQLGHFEPDVDIAGGILRVAWSPNGRYLLVGDSEGTVRILESESWSPIATLHAAESQAWCESPSMPLGRPKFTQFVRSSIPGTKGPISCLQFNTDGTLFYFGIDNVLNVYTFDSDGTSGSSGAQIDLLSSVQFSNSIKTIQWCPSKDRLGVVTRTRMLYLWDRLGVEGVEIPEGKDFMAHTIVWSPEGTSATISNKQAFCVLYDEEAEAQDTGHAWEEEV